MDIYINRHWPGLRVHRTSCAYYITLWILQINIRRR